MGRVTSFKFLGISKELSWSTNTVAVTKEAQHQLHFLRILRKSGFGSEAAGVLLSLCHWECFNILHHSVVRWELGCRQKGFEEGYQNCSENYWLPSARSGGDCHLSLPQEVWGYYFRPLPPSPPPTISLGKPAPLISIITNEILEQRHARGQDIDWNLLKFPFTGYRFISICCLMLAASDSSDWDSWLTTPGSLLITTDSVHLGDEVNIFPPSFKGQSYPQVPQMSKKL